MRIFVQFGQYGFENSSVPTEISLVPFITNCYYIDMIGKEHYQIYDIGDGYIDLKPYNCIEKRFTWYNKETNEYISYYYGNNKNICCGYKYIEYKEGIPIKEYFKES